MDCFLVSNDSFCKFTALQLTGTWPSESSEPEKSQSSLQPRLVTRCRAWWNLNLKLYEPYIYWKQGKSWKIQIPNTKPPILEISSWSLMDETPLVVSKKIHRNTRQAAEGHCCSRPDLVTAGLWRGWIPGVGWCWWIYKIGDIGPFCLIQGVGGLFRLNVGSRNLTLCVWLIVSRIFALICVNISQPLGLQNLGPEIHGATFNTNQFQMIFRDFAGSRVSFVSTPRPENLRPKLPERNRFRGLQGMDWVRSTDKGLLYGNMIHWIWYKYATYSINLWYVYFTWMNRKMRSHHMELYQWNPPKFSLLSRFSRLGKYSYELPHFAMHRHTIFRRQVHMYAHSLQIYAQIPMQRYPRTWTWPSSRTGLLFWICWTTIFNMCRMNNWHWYVCLNIGLDAFVRFCLILTKTNLVLLLSSLEFLGSHGSDRDRWTRHKKCRRMFICHTGQIRQKKVLCLVTVETFG